MTVQKPNWLLRFINPKNGMLDSHAMATLTQMASQTNTNTTLLTKGLVGFQQSFNADTTGWTRSAAGAYTYSHTTAPTTAKDYTQDTGTQITYAAKQSGSILYIQYILTGIGDYLGSRAVLALFSDASATALDWHVHQDDGASNTIFTVFSTTTSDTNSHTYSVAYLGDGTANTWTVNPGRRLLTLQEMVTF